MDTAIAQKPRFIPLQHQYNAQASADTELKVVVLYRSQRDSPQWLQTEGAVTQGMWKDRLDYTQEYSSRAVQGLKSAKVLRRCPVW